MNVSDQKLKFWVAFTFVFMSMGILAELLLLTHFEDAWQVVPIAIVACLFILVVIFYFKPGQALRKILGVTLVLCALSGLVGIYFHLNANWEFESEMHPGQTFSKTFTDSLSGALPALAPASMMVVALLGYIYILLNHENN